MRARLYKITKKCNLAPETFFRPPPRRSSSSRVKTATSSTMLQTVSDDIRQALPICSLVRPFSLMNNDHAPLRGGAQPPPTTLHRTDIDPQRTA